MGGAYAQEFLGRVTLSILLDHDTREATAKQSAFSRAKDASARSQVCAFRNNQYTTGPTAIDTAPQIKPKRSLPSSATTLITTGANTA